MKLAILGYGRMGMEVEKIAIQRKHEIVAVFDIDKPFTVDSEINGAEAIISFVLADSVVGNLKTAAQLGVPVVEGTTGWMSQLDLLKQIENLTVVHSPNFSIGVYQFDKLAAYAAKLFGPLTDYDCYLHEWHHTGKADSPSGTAKSLADTLLENLPNKDYALNSTSHSKIDPRALHVTSTRVGRVPGTHEIGFDSAVDTVFLKHEAHGREGFALGAVKAAEWVKDKKGIFTMDDFMNDLI